MKLVNTQELQKALDDATNPDQFFNSKEEEIRSPCYQVNINKDKEAFVFLVDSKEIFSHPYEGFDMSYDGIMGLLGPALAMFKEGSVKDLQKYLRAHRHD